MGDVPRTASTATTTSTSKYVDDSPRGRLHQKMQQEAGLARASTTSIDTSRLPQSPPFTLFMGNLTFDVTESDVRSFFGAGVKSVKLIADQGTGRPKGFGYVEFMSAGDLQRAAQLNGQSLKGRAVRLDISEGKFGSVPSAAGEWRKGEIVCSKASPAQSTASSDWRASAKTPLAAPEVAKPTQSDWRTRSSNQQQSPASSTLKFDHKQRSPRKQSFAVPLDIHKREERKVQSATTTPSERPVLKLQPRSTPKDEGHAKEGLAEEYLKSNKPNPFGAANPKTIEDPTLKQQAPVDQISQ